MTSVLKIEHDNDHKNECDDVADKNRNRMMTWKYVKNIYRNRIDSSIRNHIKIEIVIKNIIRVE